ncbi:histone-like nucleoid-structuring protein Lsr2 [Curtobacterium sp. MCBD17_032]|uniref:Lsr2 dimerization domain-containing protein n=1 Tax=Curtobacterium sp. MCBD17_032 TaxID=2175659 RepID=UPI000DA77549|nr:histone-like nucleoid-structuring protein Lsr2 [Curtobacterium sp. MCBD17_032]PZE81086.1 hypothetical protein DEI91_13265 [Curtobacterium sp. MCBD17_032]
MASNTTITDDLDGSTEGVKGHTFALDGKEYAIDLTDYNFAKLEGALASFIDVAHEPEGNLPMGGGYGIA